MTASKSVCFWALLSTENLRFVYIPTEVGNIKIAGESIQNLLQNRCLFEYMHPNEMQLAKKDLSTFIKLKTLAGSVTRCRLLSLPSIASNFKIKSTSRTTQNTSTWNVIDLVIYTATDDTVLVFFHNTESFCKEVDHFKCQNIDSFTEQDTQKLHHVLDQHITKRSNANTMPKRIFQIMNHQSRTPLFIWPQSSNPVMDELVQTSDMELKEFKSTSFDHYNNEIACSRHFYASSKRDILNTHSLFQRIIIPYGNILFESFQVSSITELSPVAPMYQHYCPDAFVLQQQQKKNSDFHGQPRMPNHPPVPTMNGKPIQLTLQFSVTHIISLKRKAVDNLSVNLITSSSQQKEDALLLSAAPSSKKLFQKFRVEQRQQQQILGNLDRKRKNEGRHYSTSPLANPPHESNHVKTCSLCKTSDSPEWRRGPDGHKTLCNACGLRYSRFRSKQWRTTNK